jgi:23S rRNA-/tRNA-specific pseudouridylate synthase
MILLETADFCFFDKPCGIPTIPAGNVPREETFLAAAEEMLDRPLWVVHRLDRDTSGVILFAKTAAFHREASLMFENREVKKQYWFMAGGKPDLPVFKVDLPIDGKRSRTQFRVLSRHGAYFCGEALPLTGRKHQIRIHLTKSGFPILGDTLYGGRPTLKIPHGSGEGELRALPHFFLHARSLTVGDLPRVEAPLPDEWHSLWFGEGDVRS